MQLFIIYGQFDKTLFCDGGTFMIHNNTSFSSVIKAN